VRADILYLKFIERKIKIELILLPFSQFRVPRISRPSFGRGLLATMSEGLSDHSTAIADPYGTPEDRAAAKKANTCHVTALSGSARFAPAADGDVLDAAPIALCVASADCRETRAAAAAAKHRWIPYVPIGQMKITRDDDGFTGQPPILVRHFAHIK